MNIYVGNLSYDIQDSDLDVAFKSFGEVASAKVIIDRFSNRSRGFGFVEMPKQAEAMAAIQGLNGKELKGQTITVNEARPRGSTGDRGRGSGSGQRW